MSRIVSVFPVLTLVLASALLACSASDAQARKLVDRIVAVDADGGSLTSYFEHSDSCLLLRQRTADDSVVTEYFHDANGFVIQSVYTVAGVMTLTTDYVNDAQGLHVTAHESGDTMGGHLERDYTFQDGLIHTIHEVTTIGGMTLSTIDTSYQYDVHGNITTVHSVTVTFGMTTTVDAWKVNTYDERGNLVMVVSTSSLGGEPLTEWYTYDDEGNLTHSEDSDGDSADTYYTVAQCPGDMCLGGWMSILLNN